MLHCEQPGARDRPAIIVSDRVEASAPVVGYAWESQSDLWFAELQLELKKRCLRFSQAGRKKARSKAGGLCLFK